jgi:hypothetical protein
MYLASKYIHILHHAILLLLLFTYFVIWFVFSLILIYFFQHMWKIFELSTDRNMCTSCESLFTVINPVHQPKLVGLLKPEPLRSVLV